MEQKIQSWLIAHLTQIESGDGVALVDVVQGVLIGSQNHILDGSLQIADAHAVAGVVVVVVGRRGRRRGWRRRRRGARREHGRRHDAGHWLLLLLLLVLLLIAPRSGATPNDLDRLECTAADWRQVSQIGVSSERRSLQQGHDEFADPAGKKRENR